MEKWNSIVDDNINDCLRQYYDNDSWFKLMIRSWMRTIYWKTPAPEACNFVKKETLTQVLSCEFYEFFKNTVFYRTPPGDCSWQSYEKPHSAKALLSPVN